MMFDNTNNAAAGRPEEICSRCSGIRTESCCHSAFRAQVIPALKAVEKQTIGGRAAGRKDEVQDMDRLKKTNLKKLKLVGEAIVFFIAAAALAMMLASTGSPSLFSGLI